ncbi:hypothetical protein BDW02DRAFT_567413 [Decorospora gaudefroyi]|uniref:DUF4048 domain-containing protein n=1 Tax=Decorospora gaudefroyi TaxID=184978 RepID=A0A6A5KDH8_9PLEO|nr:hypothetical protein BDW02DRAFT_567413 [Decorospora gaudefroyi]
MGSCAAGPTLMKSWLWWCRGSYLLRLVGLPAAVLALYLEVYCSSPAAASLILHRLVRRVPLSTLLCTLTLTMGHDMKSTSYLGGADSMDRAQTQTLHNKGADSSPLAASNKRLDSSTESAVTPSHPLSTPTMSSHARSKTVDVVRQGKRLSLQFPIQPAAGSSSPSFSPRSRPQSWVNGTTPILSPEPIEENPSETNILAVLAAQERYVLELKEELTKAEADLNMLKVHWHRFEDDKQRNMVRKVAALQPLNTSLANVPASPYEDDSSNVWKQKELERRKTLLSNTKTSQRKVFSGSRHLRTLSLLSPERAEHPSFPQPLDLQPEEATIQRPQLPTRASTSSDIARQMATNGHNDRYDMSGLPTIQREQLIRAGTQMATDFKKGLFTFIEDIRQATVGEEAGNAADGNLGLTGIKGLATKNARKPSDGRPPLNRSASSKKSTQQSGSIGDDFWKEMGLSEPKTTAVNKKTHGLQTSTPQKQIRKVASEEDWANWDTPNESLLIDTKDSSDESDAQTSPASGRGSSRTSTSTTYHSKRHDSKASSLTSINPEDVPREAKRNSIPWPDMVKMSPSNLKRTASHLMKEWEKQLTPPATSQDYSHGNSIGDYMN